MAQDTSANITGRITDPSGAAVANAKVTATDADRGTVFRTQTNTDGVYNLSRLPIGRYEAARGGQRVPDCRASRLRRCLSAKRPRWMSLSPSASSRNRWWSRPATKYCRRKPRKSARCSKHRPSPNLPLETRNYNQLTLLVPGSATISPASFNTGLKTFNSARPNLNGNREQANYYLLDGMENTEFVDNNVAYSPNLDAIQQMSIVTNNPSAELGQFLGGVISVGLKSGTNQYHGDAFEYLRNDFFNANEWSNNFNGLPTPRERWNEYGGTFGGPIKKNKLFFFTDYQGSRFDLPATATPKTTFTAQDATGNLSDLGVTLHYPGTNVVMPSNLTQAADLRTGTEDGREPLHHRHQPHCAEDRRRAAQAEHTRPRQRNQSTISTTWCRTTRTAIKGDVKDRLVADGQRPLLRPLLAAAHRQSRS